MANQKKLGRFVQEPPRAYRFTAECLDLLEHFAGSELASCCNRESAESPAQHCDAWRDNTRGPDHAPAWNSVQTGRPSLQVDLDRDQVVQLVGEHDRAGLDGRCSPGRQDDRACGRSRAASALGRRSSPRNNAPPARPRRGPNRDSISARVTGVSSTTSCSSPATTVSSSNPARSRIQATAKTCST